MNLILTILATMFILLLLRFAFSLFKYRKKWNDPVERQMRLFEESQKKK